MDAVGKIKHISDKTAAHLNVLVEIIGLNFSDTEGKPVTGKSSDLLRLCGMTYRPTNQ